MKICLISFDFFNFDHFIVLELKKRNIEANHIDISKFQYKYVSFFEKMTNFFYKNLLKKNIKKIKTEQYILDCLKQFGRQDIILVIRPDRISKKTHLKIKQYTEQYITYIYDSCKRFPINNLINGVFDTIYSFDLFDCKKYNFTFITNFIYLEKKELCNNSLIKNTTFIILSVDERFDFLNKLAHYFTANKIDYKFIIVGKKKPKNINSNIFFTKKPMYFNDIKNELENSKILIDLIRHKHFGLSFRIFEALAMQKKIITTNKTIRDYDFYNPNNILILDEDCALNINHDFFITPYEPLSDLIYNKYTMEHWVNTVFKLQ